MILVSVIVYNIWSIICYTIAVITAKNNKKAGKIWFWIGIAIGSVLAFGSFAGKTPQGIDILDTSFFIIISIISALLIFSKQAEEKEKNEQVSIAENRPQKDSPSSIMPEEKVRQEEPKKETGKIKIDAPIMKESTEITTNNRQRDDHNELVFFDGKTYIQGILPLAVSNTRILKNQDDGQLTLSFDITSSSEESISALLVSVEFYSVWGDKLGTDKFQIIDLKTDKFIPLEDVAHYIIKEKEARKAILHIDRIAFANGNTLTNNNAIIPVEGGYSYQDFLTEKERAEQLNSEKERRLSQLRMLNMNSPNFVSGYISLLLGSKSIYDITRSVRGMSEIYPDLFSDELLTQVKAIERKQAEVGGDLKKDAVKIVATHLQRVQEELGQ